MKSLILLAMTLAIIAILGVVTIWHRVMPDGYPFYREITDKKGRPVDATILGKLGDTAYFTRTDDPKIYDYMIADLSSMDRWVLTMMPDQAPPEPKPEKPPEPVNDYTTVREAKISDLQRKLKIVEIELSARIDNPGIQRKREREKEVLQKEIRRLQRDVEIYRLNAAR